MIRFRPRSDKAHRHALARRPTRALSIEWQTWLAQNLLNGVPLDRLQEKLLRHGVPPAECRRRASSLTESPAFVAAARMSRQARQLTMATTLYTELAKLAASPRRIERKEAPTASEFFDRYYATNIPVVLTDLLETSAAREWTPELLAERYADVVVEIIDGRSADPDYDMNFERHRTRTTMRAYVDRIRAVDGETNDFYMIANNKNVARAELSSLFDDFTWPEGYVDRARVPRGSALWLGPAGTITPLHHDTSSILFCQLYGRKRIELVSPLEAALLPTARGVYATIGLDAPSESTRAEMANVTILSVDLQPGETLFIPVGWWHYVRAFDVSISLAVNALARPNRFEWYKPGSLNVEK